MGWPRLPTPRPDGVCVVAVRPPRPERAPPEIVPERPTRKPRVRATALDGPCTRALAALAARGHHPTEVQTRTFTALADPGHALIVAPTGAGKTAAVFLPLLAAVARRSECAEGVAAAGVQVLYIAPVRALVSGHALRIQALANDVGARIRVGVRTGDTPARERVRQRTHPPEVLAVTPESLAVILAGDARRMLSTVTDVVLDEVHALASGKRGALLSATLETLVEVLRAAGRHAPRRVALSATAHPVQRIAAWVGPGTRVISAEGPVHPVVELADPGMDGPYPPAGWTWRVALPVVARRVAQARSTVLVFVNTRARAEQWTLALRDVLPSRMPVACFHGSLSAEERASVAEALACGSVRAVVATSSLESGVDLPTVSEVVMVSAPASVTRLVQAAGRAEHRPGAVPHAALVPTSANDIVRCAAVLRATARRETESVDLRAGDLDVAVQAAMGILALGPCDRHTLAQGLRRSWAFRHLSDADIDAVLNFLATGGDALAAYPELARAVSSGDHWALASPGSLQRYRRAVGTIVGEVTVTVHHGPAIIGHIDGRFASLLGPGERFALAGRTWRVISLTGNSVHVHPDRANRRSVPAWAGSRAPQSDIVSAEIRTLWGALGTAVADVSPSYATRAVAALLGVGEANARAVAALVRAQRARSVVPGPGCVLVEVVPDGRRTHVVVFTFAGQLANEVIARTAAERLRRTTGSGAELSACEDAFCITVAGISGGVTDDTLRTWLAPEDLARDFASSVSGSVLAGAYFREVARVSQLWTPNARRGSVTSGLLYDVLRKHDPGHVLLRALEHTLWTALEGPRAVAVLTAAMSDRWVVTTLDRPSPMAIPVFAWALRDAVAPDDPEAALAAAAHMLFARATEGLDV